MKFRSALSGAVTLFGGLAISKALTKGYGGVVQALASTQAVWSTILTTIFFKDIPNKLEILGLVIGFGGALVLSLGKVFWGH